MTTSGKDTLDFYKEIKMELGEKKRIDYHRQQLALSVAVSRFYSKKDQKCAICWSTNFFREAEP